MCANYLEGNFESGLISRLIAWFGGCCFGSLARVVCFVVFIDGKV